MKKLCMFLCVLALAAVAAQATDKDLTVKNFVVPAADSAARPLPGDGAFVATRTIDFAAEADNCNTNDTLVMLWLPDDAYAFYAVCGSPDGFGTTNAVSVTPKYWDSTSNAWSNVVSAQSVSTSGVWSAATSLSGAPKKFGITLGGVPAEGEYTISVFGFRR